MTLEQVFKFVEAKEVGKRSASRLLDSPGAEATSSSYRRRRNTNVAKDTNKYDNNKVELCGYCGKKGQGKSTPPKIRKKKCPTYGHTCKHCERDNHYESVCRSNTKTKTVIVSEIEEGVRIFDKSKPTCLATDWSKSGLGFWLFQKHCEFTKLLPFCCHEGWKITLVGSRFTHGAESRYPPVEGEALAVVDALDKASRMLGDMLMYSNIMLSFEKM
ncbi:unnamed protein product [Mytilus coruscus]|uniref:Reverse transcriptase RNase H-like domain-containing protein n=1 Tax=Mytilus coruscus TaxID=42192 RepID=A0A6J8E7Y6_MYTCO|nr:unnamed protein product [Mytilus coruscus]